jgi:hypothetical protein
MILLVRCLQRSSVGYTRSTLRCFNHLTSPPSKPFHSRSLTTSTCIDSDYEDYYRYTGGRFLWDEETRLRERYKRFNVHELQKLAAQSVGARDCVSMSKLPEGGYNKLFRLVMDDDKVVIARILNPNAGPAFKTTASEVATMNFVS